MKRRRGSSDTNSDPEAGPPLAAVARFQRQDDEEENAEDEVFLEMHSTPVRRACPRPSVPPPLPPSTEASTAAPSVRPADPSVRPAAPSSLREGLIPSPATTSSLILPSPPSSLPSSPHPASIPLPLSPQYDRPRHVPSAAAVPVLPPKPGLRPPPPPPPPPPPQCDHVCPIRKSSLNLDDIEVKTGSLAWALQEAVRQRLQRQRQEVRERQRQLHRGLTLLQNDSSPPANVDVDVGQALRNQCDVLVTLRRSLANEFERLSSNSSSDVDQTMILQQRHTNFTQNKREQERERSTYKFHYYFYGKYFYF